MDNHTALSRRLAVICSLLVGLYVVFFKIYDERDPRYVSPNERPRLLLAHAIAERFSVEITSEVQRFGWSIDMAKRGERYYSDKPIFQSILAAPVIAAYRRVSSGEFREANVLWLVKTTTLVPFALLLFWLFYGAVFSFSRSVPFSLLSAWSLFAGTPVSTYFTVFFSHSVSAALLFAFFLLVRRAIAHPERSTLFFTGLVGACAFLNEYQTAVPLVILSLFLFLSLREKRLFLFFVGGTLPLAALFIAYNLVAFGTPLTFGVAHEEYEEFRAMHQKGLFGIGLPNGRVLLDLFFSLKMGVFTLSPFLLFAIVGAYRRWCEARGETLTLLSLILSYFIMISSLENPHGGWAFGARYLVPVIPFIGLLAAYGMRDLFERRSFWRVAAGTLVFVSCLIFTVANGMRPLIEEIFRNPIANYYLMALRERYFIFSSILSPFGAIPYHSFVAFFAIFTTVTVVLVSSVMHPIRRIAGTAIAAAAAVIILTIMFFPYHGRQDERKFFYWMMVQDRAGASAAMKEQIFDNAFGRSAEILRSIRHAK